MAGEAQPRRRRKRATDPDLMDQAAWIASVAVAHVVHQNPSPLELYTRDPQTRAALEAELLRIADCLEDGRPI